MTQSEYEKELKLIMMKDLRNETLTPDELAFVHQCDDMGVQAVDEELIELKKLQKRIENGESSVVILDSRINQKTGERATSVSELIKIIEQKRKSNHE